MSFGGICSAVDYVGSWPTERTLMDADNDPVRQVLLELRRDMAAHEVFVAENHRYIDRVRAAKGFAPIDWPDVETD